MQLISVISVTGFVMAILIYRGCFDVSFICRAISNCITNLYFKNIVLSIRVIDTVIRRISLLRKSIQKKEQICLAGSKRARAMH